MQEETRSGWDVLCAAEGGRGSDAAAHAEMKVSHEELVEMEVPLVWRDYCAHILVPLNKCRRQNFYLPWKCGELRHAYEICQHEECVIGRAAPRVGSVVTRACVRARFPRFQRRYYRQWKEEMKSKHGADVEEGEEAGADEGEE